SVLQWGRKFFKIIVSLKKSTSIMLAWTLGMVIQPVVLGKWDAICSPFVAWGEWLSPTGKKRYCVL
ncbi:MAG: hypothetical protein KKG88_05595, partial [Proteobacteria bacterium]|nr:hypothetical protein [Pseudomonadota bacterium]